MWYNTYYEYCAPESVKAVRGIFCFERWVTDIANHSRMIGRLQTAILNAGGVVKVNTHQFHSQEQNRMITSYSVIVPTWSEFRQKMVDHEVLKTCSAVEVVKFLANVLEGLRNGTDS